MLFINIECYSISPELKLATWQSDQEHSVTDGPIDAQAYVVVLGFALAAFLSMAHGFAWADADRGSFPFHLVGGLLGLPPVFLARTACELVVSYYPLCLIASAEGFDCWEANTSLVFGGIAWALILGSLVDIVVQGFWFGLILPAIVIPLTVYASSSDAPFLKAARRSRGGWPPRDSLLGLEDAANEADFTS